MVKTNIAYTQRPWHHDISSLDKFGIRFLIRQVIVTDKQLGARRGYTLAGYRFIQIP